MKEKSIFMDDIDMPEIVQTKADTAFSDIRKRGINNMDQKHNFAIKNIIKPVIAIASCAALIAVAITGNRIFDTHNEFSIYVMGSELQKGHSVPLTEKYTDGWGPVIGNEGKNLDYFVPLPFKFEGNNITGITYSINRGALQINNLEGKDIVVDGKPFAFDEDSENPLYKSFKLDYNTQSDENTLISTCYTITDNSELINKIFVKNTTIEEQNDAINELLENTVITCTVHYSDGTSESADILLKSIIAPAENFDYIDISGIECPTEEPLSPTSPECTCIVFELQ